MPNPDQTDCDGNGLGDVSDLYSAHGRGSDTTIGANHVVLVDNFDQAQQVIGEINLDRAGLG